MHQLNDLLKNKKYNLFLQFALLIIVIFNITTVLYPHREKYLSHNYWQRYESLKKTYYDSQYANKHPKGWVPDEVVLSFAGGALIKGENPVLIIADSPPLSKYLIGLSALIFDNENIVTVFFGILSLVFLYLLSLQIFKNRLLSLVPLAFLSFEPIFKNQFVYSPLLDIMQMAFMLGSFYFFNKGFSSKKSWLFYFLANIFLGMFISTKFFITGGVIAGAYLFILLIHRDKRRLFEMILTLPFSVAVLLLSYIRVLYFGYSLKDMIGIQKWIFLYHKSQLILPFTIWPLLFINKWYIWWGDKRIITSVEWNIMWPIITAGFLITLLLYLLKKIPRKKEFEITIVWATFYLMFFSMGQISPRYLIILLPIFYIITIYGVVGIYQNKYVKKKSK